MRSWMCIAAAAILAAGGLAADRRIVQTEFRRVHSATHLYERPSGYVSRVYGRAFGFGESPEATAEHFRLEHADVLGARPEDLVPGNDFNGNLTQLLGYDRNTDSYRFTLVYYRQERGGVPVFRGELRLLVRNEADHPLVLATNGIRDLGDFDPARAAVPLRADLGLAAATAAYPELTNFSEPREVIFAGVEDEVGVAPRMAVAFTADNGLPHTPEFEKRLFVTDAQTGAVLFDEDQIVHATITGLVRGNATTGSKADLCNSEALTAMKYARVSRGAVVAYADASGNYAIDDGGGGTVTLLSEVRGRYFRVWNDAGTESSISTNGSAPGPINFNHNSANTSATYRAEVNGYVQSNVVRDYTLTYNPSYPVIVGQTEPSGSVFPVHVNIASTCNAYYDGSSINFYQSGGGCANTAFATVVHHEYGHHLVASAGSGQGAYGEGFGDIMGVLITNESLLGIGFQNNCSNGIRNANNTCQYQTSGCSSCGSEIHACGQLISGCVWSTRTYLLGTNPSTYRDIISNLAIDSMPLHNGSSIAPDITIDFLTLDDDNADIGDGTPHYTEISSGFGDHNMDAPPLSPLDFDFPNGLPAQVLPTGGTTVRVNVSARSSSPQPNTGKLYFRANTGDPYTSAAMTQVTPNVYDAVFPAVQCGATVQFYFSAKTTTNVEVFSPSDAPATAYSALSAVGTGPATFTDDFDADLGWTVQNGGATNGFWTRVDPFGTELSGIQAQPDNDATSGSTMCYITGQAVGEDFVFPNNSDLDGGPMHLVSPTFNLAGSDALVTYSRWFFSSSNGTDPAGGTMTVAVSNNGGSSWTDVETFMHDPGWKQGTFRVGAFVTPTANVKFRITVSENGGYMCTEAGIDHVALQPIDCGFVHPAGDLNCDGTVNPFDINGFMLALTDPPGYGSTYPNCDAALADMNGDGTVNPFDIAGFLAAIGP